MIKGHCRTNLDIGRMFEWPRVFVAVPIRGEYVRSLDGRCVLKVSSITHYTDVNGEPCVEVELNR